MSMLQGGQGFFQVAAPNVTAVDHAQGQHLISRQAIEDGRVLIRCTHQVDVQAVHRQVGCQAEVLFQAAKIGGHQLLQRVALDQVVGTLEGVFPILRQVQHQDRLVDLHPFHAQVRQALEDLAVQRQEAVQQVEFVEITALGLAQPQIGQRADDDRLDGVAEVTGFLDLFEQLLPTQLELLVGAEFRDQVVIVGVEPLGHFLGVGTAAAVVTDATGHTEQGVQGGFAVGRAETLGDHTEHQRVSQYLVVPGEVTGGQQFDAGLLLQVPVRLAQFTTYGAQAGFVELALPKRFLRFFQFTIATNARESKGMGNSHDVKLQCVCMGAIVGIE
eukprot:gene20101-biopygen20389